jgi:hypothetical protein
VEKSSGESFLIIPEVGIADQGSIQGDVSSKAGVEKIAKSLTEAEHVVRLSASTHIQSWIETVLGRCFNQLCRSCRPLEEPYQGS